MKIFDAQSLLGKTYLVTGGSSGIGRETAKLLSQCGAAVIVAGRDLEKLKQSLQDLSGTGHISTICDFSGADQTSDWVKSLVEEYGPLDGVFHCAGIELIRPIRMTKQTQIEEVFGSSIYAAFGLSRGLNQKNALNDGASIVFMSSVAAISGQVGMTVYSAAKAAIDGLVRSLACEFASRHIRVNSIVAGAVKTEMHERLTRSSGDEGVVKYESMHLLGFGEAEDIANCAVYLLGPASRWVTGTAMVVDGGYMVR
jgi:NAD(P)-dependent dehydrogenase (short-subunit alcohol dehydrogenase family)